MGFPSLKVVSVGHVITKTYFITYLGQLHCPGPHKQCSHGYSVHKPYPSPYITVWISIVIDLVLHKYSARLIG